MIWPGIVIALLVGQIVVSLFAVSLALSDPSQAVEPDYYAKSLRWDTTQAQLRASEALHWTAVWNIAPTADILGQREVRLTLTDAQGQPIHDAAVNVLFFHHARSADRQEQPLTAAGDGVYLAVLPMRRDGIWQLELTVTHGETMFVETQTPRVGNSRKITP